MLINEVEHVVGLSKKSIRYYEENGLLKPKRNEENDYRIYDEYDIGLLRKIKFLRELGVSIRELKLLESNDLSLAECLEDKIKKMTLEEKKYEIVKGMCKEIIERKDDFENFDYQKHYEKMNILGKEGFTLRDIKTNKKKKIIGAVLSSSIFSIFSIGFIVLISYFQFTVSDKMPWIMYIILMSILAFPLIALIVNLIERIKEILGGEEDEASKY